MLYSRFLNNIRCAASHPTITRRHYCASSITPGDFSKYTEFDVPKDGFIRQLLTSSTEEWIAQEKVHGANFGVHVFNKGKHIRYAKRSGFMHDHEYFFGYTKLIPQWEKQVEPLYNAVQDFLGPNEELDALVMNGELFGGKYVHPDLPPKEYLAEFKGQQRRISAIQADFFPQYSPDIHFFAFDLKYRRSPAGEWINIGPLETLRIFEQVPDLLYAKPLVRGSLEKVLAFDMDNYETTLPHILGYGNLVMPQNYGEGIVVRSEKRSGPSENLSKSTILKFKHRLFQESRHSEKIGARDPLQELRLEIMRRCGETMLDPASFMLESEQQSLRNLLDMVCENRLQSVISKYGLDVFDTKSALPPSERKSEWDLATLIATDAWKDWLKLVSDDELKYSLFLRRHFANYLKAEAQKFVRSRWASVSKGRFEDS